MIQKILVTGAGGFIGHHMVRYLRAKGYWVRGVDIEKPKFSPDSEANDFVIADLKDPINCRAVTLGIDKVYNFAAMNGSIELTTTNKAELVHNNALINLNMAEACWKNKVGRIYYASSACVYPLELQETNRIIPLNEGHVYPAQPDSEYGWEKLFSERLWLDYKYDRGLEVRIGRYFNIYGPESLIDTIRSKAPMALTRKVIEAKHNGKEFIEIWGDGGQKRSFFYIDDCVEATYRLMETDHSQPLNLGTPDLVSIDQLVDTICVIENARELKRVYLLDKIQGVRVRQGDFSKMNDILHIDSHTWLHLGMMKLNKFVHEQLGY